MTAPVQEGDVLDGKYRIDKVLGIGGMGVVVAATHTGLDRKVAIKFLLPIALQHPEIVERFDREARAAATVKGQHVVHVIDVGKLPDGRAFMVMEYLDGKDLERTLEERGQLGVSEAIGYILEACEALAEAHQAGIVHRDLKPANLFLALQPDKRAIVKVLDFGISKVKDDGRQLTRTSTAMGTPFYMSPEQLMNSKDVDARSDIWALGVILFELLSNTRPYDGEAMPEIVAKILGNQRPVLRTLNSEVPAKLEEVIAKCLQSDRENRFSTVGELARALSAFASAAGQTSVDRISRVLGDPSLPPPSPGGRRPMVSGPPTAVGLDVIAIEMPKSPDLGIALPKQAKPAGGTLASGESGAPVVAATLGSMTSTPPPGQAAASKGKNMMPAIAAVAVLAVGGGGAALWATRTPTQNGPETVVTAPTLTASQTGAGVAVIATATQTPLQALPSVSTTVPLVTPSASATTAHVRPVVTTRATQTAAPRVTAQPTPTSDNPLNVKIK